MHRKSAAKRNWRSNGEAPLVNESRLVIRVTFRDDIQDTMLFPTNFSLCVYPIYST